MSLLDFPRPRSVVEPPPKIRVPRDGLSVLVCAECGAGRLVVKVGVVLKREVACRVCQSTEWRPEK